MLLRLTTDKSARSLRRRRHWRAFSLVLVPLLIMVVVEGIPTLAVIWISLTDYNPVVADSWQQFTGTANYERLLADGEVWQALINTAYFGVLFVPIAVVGGLVLAMLLNQRIRGRTFFRGVYFFPVVVSWVVAATMFAWLLDPNFGLVSASMDKFLGVTMPALLQEPGTAMPTLALVGIWKLFGFNVVIYLAGLQTQDQALLEAATIDGASSLQRFWYVTLPMLRPVTALVVAFNLIHAFRIIEPMLIMTGGGPNFSTTSLVLHYYRVGWGNLDFGYGAAIVILLSLLIVLVAGVQLWATNRRSADV